MYEEVLPEEPLQTQLQDTNFFQYNAIQLFLWHEDSEVCQNQKCAPSHNQSDLSSRVKNQRKTKQFKVGQSVSVDNAFSIFVLER